MFVFLLCTSITVLFFSLLVRLSVLCISLFVPALVTVLLCFDMYTYVVLELDSIIIHEGRLTTLLTSDLSFRHKTHTWHGLVNGIAADHGGSKLVTPYTSAHGRPRRLGGWGAASHPSRLPAPLPRLLHQRCAVRPYTEPASRQGIFRQYSDGKACSRRLPLW